MTDQPEGTPPQPPQPPVPTINLQGRPEVLEGIYANFAQVRESPYEITLEFANLDFQTLTGSITGRVSMSPILAQHS